MLMRHEVVVQAFQFIHLVPHLNFIARTIFLATDSDQTPAVLVKHSVACRVEDILPKLFYYLIVTFIVLDTIAIFSCSIRAEFVHLFLIGPKSRKRSGSPQLPPSLASSNPWFGTDWAFPADFQS